MPYVFIQQTLVEYLLCVVFRDFLQRWVELRDQAYVIGRGLPSLSQKQSLGHRFRRPSPGISASSPARCVTLATFLMCLCRGSSFVTGGLGRPQLCTVWVWRWRGGVGGETDTGSETVQLQPLTRESWGARCQDVHVSADAPRATDRSSVPKGSQDTWVGVGCVIYLSRAA